MASHYAKLSLKAQHSSPDSRAIITTTLINGEKIQKGYRKISAQFATKSNETNPLLILENYLPGWIGSIKIDKV